MTPAERAELRKAADLLGPVMVSYLGGGGPERDSCCSLMRRDGVNPIFTGGPIAHSDDEPEIEALAAAVNALPALLDALEVAEKALADGREACARVAEGEEARIKHTSHRDGLGMGSLCCEAECRTVAAAIRGLKP